MSRSSVVYTCPTFSGASRPVRLASSLRSKSPYAGPCKRSASNPSRIDAMAASSGRSGNLAESDSMLTVPRQPPAALQAECESAQVR